MDNIRKSIEILFKKENPERILNDYFSLRKDSHSEGIEREYFKSIFSYENPLYYNEDEIDNVADIMESRWMAQDECNKENTIFNILLEFTGEVLREINGEPHCRYDKLLKWRELSYQLGEDILTTSYFAYNDLVSNRYRDHFAWKPVVSTDNHALKELFKRGVAENHFHLKGSSPHFQLSWVSLMNNPFGREKEFKRLNKELRRSPTSNHGFQSESSALELQLRKAAYIRYYLFCKIKGIEPAGSLKDLLTARSLSEFDLYGMEVERELTCLKHEYGKRFEDEIPDYGIFKGMSKVNYNCDNPNYNGNLLLYGERRFLYHCFKEIYRGKSGKIYNYRDIFYAYLIIKQQFRDELIQINRRVGFNNFSKYQDRKQYFIPKGSIFQKAILNMAINSSIVDQHIESLEARIAPEDSMEKFHKTILQNDSAVRDKGFFHEDILDTFERKTSEKKENTIDDEKFFYNVHFIKFQEKFKEYKKANLDQEMKPRNHGVRRNIEKQAKELNRLRKSSRESAKRILGIDAANFEIACRPEVFGQVFRFLKNYSYYNELEIFGKNNFKELGLSFHVGEDFLNISSGLRAIDEAITYLELDQGDRLGHAIALGIGVRDYYESKNCKVILPKHDLLDNYAWLLAKFREYNLDVSSNLKYQFERNFKYLFNEIYGGSVKDTTKHCCHNLYYEAMKLRGDNPEYYIDGKFNMKNPLSFWERSGVRQGKDLEQIREDSMMVELYSNYHFSAEVKKRGSLSEEFKVTDDYIDAIEKLQKAMQFEVRRKNIYIETNPSSNYVISSFKRYSKHPMLNFFNLGLTYDPKELKECPQIPISINTDDQGVFATYLENEYALMAIALEKEKDEEGNPKYNLAMIYEWLDKIRQFGLEQSFNRRQKNK